MTYTKHSDHYSDDNGNRNYFSHFGGEQQALDALKSLTNCQNCRNCWNCTDCHNCIGCTDCHNCRYCTDCRGCNYCWNCTDFHTMRGVQTTVVSPVTAVLDLAGLYQWVANTGIKRSDHWLVYVKNEEPTP